MAKTTQTLTLITTTGIARESKNYTVLNGTVVQQAGKAAVLIGNDGAIYLHKALATVPPTAKVTITLTIEG